MNPGYRFSWGAVALGAAAAVGRSAPLPFYSASHPSGSVLVSAAAESDERRAASELSRVLGLMAGSPWSVRVGRPEVPGSVWIGTSADRPEGGTLKVAADPLAAAVGAVGPDAFRMEVHGGRVWIEAASAEACPFAASWFLQTELGARWYSPGPAGELVPRRVSASLEDANRLVEPAYFSRQLTGFEDAEGRQWAERNGLRQRLDFTHALGRSFPPALFDRHPNLFPVLDGRRYRPSSPGDPNWQPNLADPEAAPQAAQSALRFFSAHPDEISYSLGINDSVRFDQGAETQRALEPRRVYRGMPDYSSLVFGFMNRTAAIVAQERPGRYLGCLAYFWCQNAPAFPVDSHVLPYVASDRSQYFDRGFRETDLDLLDRWGKSGVRAFGLWEYAYGDGFVVPREPVRYLAEAAGEGWRRGARGYIAELGRPGPFDTFKAWALARLLWDPLQSVEALADDFFSGYYGPAAAPVRQFFADCQAQWEGQPGPGFWLKYFQQADQALLFPPEVCRRLRTELERARAAVAPTTIFGLRVAQLARAFERTEAYVEYDAARRAVMDEAAKASPGVPAEGGPAALRRLAVARARIGADPGIADRLLRDDPGGTLLLTADADPSAPAELLRKAGARAEACASWRLVAAALAAGVDRLPNQLENSSFAQTRPPTEWPRFLFPGMGDLPARWVLRAMATAEGRVALIPSTLGGNPGERDLRVEAAWDTQLYQWMPADPGSTYLATASLRGSVRAGGDAALVLTFVAGDGTVLASQNASLPLGIRDRWLRLALAGLAPSEAKWVGVGVAAARQQQDDWMEARAVEMRTALLAPGS